MLGLGGVSVWRCIVMEPRCAGGLVGVAGEGAANSLLL